jgi:hypothetical protein
MAGRSYSFLLDRLVRALTEGGRDGFDPAEIAAGLDLQDGDEIGWRAQSYFPERGMVNLYCVRERGHPDAFIATFSGDGGAFAGWLGPERTRADLESAIGPAPEGWSPMLS